MYSANTHNITYEMACQLRDFEQHQKSKKGDIFFFSNHLMRYPQQTARFGSTINVCPEIARNTHLLDNALQCIPYIISTRTQCESRQDSPETSSIFDLKR